MTGNTADGHARALPREEITMKKYQVWAIGPPEDIESADVRFQATTGL
jgi:hypothetical protein